MDTQNLTTNVVEEQVERSLTNVNASPMNNLYNLQDLQKLEFIKTPKDTPLFKMLMDKGAVQARSIHFEWDEAILDPLFSSALYDGYTYNSSAEANSTVNRGENWISALHRVARVSGLAQSVETVDGNAMNIQTRHQYMNLIRAIEYYLWNGDHTASVLQMNGVVTLVTTAIANGGGVLLEAKLQEAIIQMIDEGLEPTDVFASPVVCYVIANYSEKRIRYDSVDSVQGGTGARAFFYNTPFGYTVKVNPVRTTFIPTGTVYVLDMECATLRHTTDNVINSKPVGTNAVDGMAVAFTAYVSLELKAKEKHRVITGVAEALA